jgi:hypothetical protein
MTLREVLILSSASDRILLMISGQIAWLIPSPKSSVAVAHDAASRTAVDVKMSFSVLVDDFMLRLYARGTCNPF